jgi:hypothetical protein
MLHSSNGWHSDGARMAHTTTHTLKLAHLDEREDLPRELVALDDPAHRPGVGRNDVAGRRKQRACREGGGVQAAFKQAGRKRQGRLGRAGGREGITILATSHEPRKSVRIFTPLDPKPSTLNPYPTLNTKH